MDRLLPDDEALLSAFLRRHPAVMALTGDRVGTRLPHGRPAIRLARLGSPPAQRWEDRPELQVECWADDVVTAKTLARTVIAALPDLLDRRDLDGLVKGYDITLGPLWAPDPFTDQARYLIQVQLLIYAAT